jgi:hypothetical protein
MVAKEFYRVKIFIFGLLLGAIAGCQGSQELENRLAVNPALVSESPKADPSPTPRQEPSASPLPVPSASLPAVSPNAFSDLQTLDPALQSQIQELTQLDIITPAGAGGFQGDQPISRQEFARWLIRTNNRFFADQPQQQIRLAPATATPVFQDVKANSPYFGEIQGLAAAGIIPSSLTNEPNASLFRPTASLTREELIAWKVPLDNRRALPTTTLENLRDTWGFQDSAKINPAYWKFLYGDFQNGDRSNVRRVFGFTTLFQPKQPVTRTEAALALWYLGGATEGRSAPEVLKLATPPASPLPSPSPSGF